MKAWGSEGLRLLRFEGLGRVDGVLHAVSTRWGGVSGGDFADLNLGLHVGDRVADVMENRRRLARALGAGLGDLCFAEQVHGGEVALVGEAEWGRGSGELRDAVSGVDALVTRREGLWLVILVADCVPVLVADPVRGVVAAAHAGWRGTVEGVARRSVERMVEAFGSEPGQMRAAIGPSIGPEDFEVGPEVSDRFRDVFPAADLIRTGDGDRSLVDLWGANRLQLERAGLRREQIEVAGISSWRETGRFFSHRAEEGRTGRFAACIALDATIGGRSGATSHQRGET